MLRITFFHHIRESWHHHRFFWHTKKRAYNFEILFDFGLRLEFQRGQAGDCQNNCCLNMTLLFFSLYLTFPLPDRFLEKKKCVATWNDNREFELVQGRVYGFYFYNWALVWHWHARVHESASSDPWWMHQYICIDDLFLGRRLMVKNELIGAQDCHFKIGEKDFVMNDVRWERISWFRSRIPFSLYHKTLHYVNMDIKEPPMRAGKGEHSWDCGDDSTFGMSRLWGGPTPTWKNRDECAEQAVRIYVEKVFKDAKRYGSARGERGFSLDDDFKFIGWKRKGDEPVLEQFT